MIKSANNNSELILVKIAHPNDGSKSKVIKFTLENGISMVVTPGHYIYVSRGEGSDEIAQILSQDVFTGDFMILEDVNGRSKVKVVLIEDYLVPGSDLVHVYTPSGNLLVNGGILASTKAEFDLSEYHVPVMNFIYKYVSTSAPQYLANLASRLQLATYVKNVYNYF